MNIDDNNKYALIDDYLSGEMPQDQVDKFRAFLQSDADLHRDLLITRELEEAIAFDQKEAALHDTLNSIRAKETYEKTSQSSTKRYLLMGLGLSLLTYLLLTFFNPFAKEKKPENHFSQLAMVEPLYLSNKSSDQNAQIAKIESHFNAGDYTSVLPLIHAYMNDHPRDLDILLAQGIAYTETGNYVQAHQVFAKIAALKPRVAKYKWYDALAYYKEGKLGQARSILNNIYIQKTYNHEKALELLRYIN